MTPPRNREELTLTLGEPAHGGACVARDDDGRVVFVRHGLPGEKVVARVSATRKRLAWANVIEVLEASPDRVEPAWPQAAREKIGGAELCHVRPAAQRTWKEDVLRGQIRRVGGEGLAQAVDSIGGVHVQACPGDEDPDDLLLHRRTRIELVADKDGRLGMSRYRSNQVVALESMPLAVDALCEIGLFDGNDSRWLTAWESWMLATCWPSGRCTSCVVTPARRRSPASSGSSRPESLVSKQEPDSSTTVDAASVLPSHHGAATGVACLRRGRGRMTKRMCCCCCR